MGMADRLFANRYRLERRLGVGGMATVQLAFDTKLQRNVAVKLLAEHLAEDSSFVARFRREALAAAKLVHPNVVQVFDFGLDDDTHRQFIVMEFVDGESCAEILRDQGALDAEEAVEILAQACRGLDYAHRNGVVHRDVKPGNLLRNREGTVKLADFGIAKAAEDSEITKVGSVLGTAAYLSPEQARGEPAQPASDLYALGVVSYQLLTGRLPYEAASLTDLARMQESALPMAPHEVVPEVPNALSLAVMRALHPRPDGRYADAIEMAESLRGALHGVMPDLAEDATAALDQTAATRMLGDATAATQRAPRTSARPAQRTRRPLEPIEEPPRRREPARRPAAPPPRRRKRRSPFRTVFALVLLLGMAVIGVLGYQLVSEGTQRGVQLRETVQGDVQQAVDELKGLIEDNTR
jgi:serine/threonine protein kinase